MYLKSWLRALSQLSRGRKSHNELGSTHLSYRTEECQLSLLVGFMVVDLFLVSFATCQRLGSTLINIPAQDNFIPNMNATEGLSSSTTKSLPRTPVFGDSVRRRMRWLYYHPRTQKIQGYHFGILCCAVASAAVMVMNLTLSIWASRRYGLQEGLGTIQEGSCGEIKNLATLIHLGINMLSTLLLGASNYTMQCLSFPTRKDIDRAHGKNVWLNIGTPSIRNLRRISRFRMLLWFLVAISSVPLHLMYNSAVFTTLSARNYYAILVQSGLSTDATFNTSAISNFPEIESNTLSVNGATSQSVVQMLQNSQSSLQNLTRKDCKETYAADFVSSHANVLAIAPDWTESSNGSDFILQVWYAGPFGASDNSTWYDDPRFEYCLSQTVEEHCQVQFSGAIMIVVTVCNLCKMIIMVYIAVEKPSEPLVTVGDALASFLDQPDPTTIGMCLAAKSHFEKATPPGSDSGQIFRPWGEEKLRYDFRTSYWYETVSMRRWTLLLVL